MRSFRPGRGGVDLWALAAVENVASRRVLEKVGFGYVGAVEPNRVAYPLYRFDG